LAVLGLVILAGLAGARSRPQVEDFETYHATAREELVDRLESHAGWCRGRKVFVEYGRVLRLILDFEPGNATALKGLGYKKRGQEWVAPKTPKQFKNFNESALAEAERRYQKAIDPLLDSHLARVAGGTLLQEQKQALLTDVLRLDPENEWVASASIEVRAAAAGCLPETLSARERRAEINELVKQAFASAPRAEAIELTDKDAALGVEWLGAVATPSLRVVYATDEGEARRLLVALHAADALFTSLFPRRRGLPHGLSVYLMENDHQKGAFLANHPGIDDDYRAFLQKLGGSGIQGSRDFAFWSGDAQRRADGLVRIALGWMFQGGFGFSIEAGWAYEGIGLYLTRKLVRTRLNWTASAAAGVDPNDDFRQRTHLLRADTNWMEEARQLWAAGNAPAFGQLLTKSVDQLSTEDILAAYALAAYLIEGQATQLEPFLRFTGSGMPVDKQVERVFGFDMATLRERTGRWLAERR